MSKPGKRSSQKPANGSNTAHPARRGRNTSPSVCRHFHRIRSIATRIINKERAMRNLFFMVSFLLASTTAVHAELKKQTLEYKDGDTTLEGYLVYDDAVQGKRPGIVVVHDWMGFGPYANG